MDLLHKKEKYNQFLGKVIRLKERLDGDSGIGEVRENLNALLEELRDKSDIREVRLLYALLGIPLCIVLTWTSVDLQNVYILVIPVVLSIVFFVGASYFMRSAIYENRSLKWNGAQQEKSPKVFLISKVRYLDSALDIKDLRMKLVQVFYMFFFPILLYYLFILVMPGVPFESSFLGWSVAFVMGICFWYLYFRRLRGEIITTKEVVSEYKTYLENLS